MGVKAVVTQSAPNRPPTMGEGDVDPALLWDWFTKCENYLRHKGVDGNDMVKTVAYGMSSVRAIRWLAAKGPVLHEMDWDTYKLQMRALFLTSDWEHTTRMEILRLRQNSKPFMDFAFEVMGKNNLLAGTDSFLNDDFLRETLEAGMEQELSRECNRENTHATIDFQRWMEEVKRLDERRRARLEELTREIAKLGLRSAPSTRTPFAKNTASSSAPPAPRNLTPMPKLTDTERTLLSTNGGCYRCRKFWAGHIGPRCTAPPLDGATYKTLTAKDVPPRPTNYRDSASRSAVAALLAQQQDQGTPGSTPCRWSHSPIRFGVR
ncbi:hypothetical protein BDN71DRAFT_409700 [Pleurotus eryngii]|uniref:Retrotransposon gag domain-containing protein n=1 Tax=Pleurotus eryngii TaxID=5323 RepID=A0A9P5ZK63_PLEER|nr:hypothetical protein BDN71DRAFT_409700 [Pleurotus eryngii]